MQSFKTKRQVQYQTADGSKRGMSQTNETPLSIGLRLYVHQKTKSNELIETPFNMNLSVNSQKVLNIKTNVETSVKEKAAKQQGGIYIPSVISPNKPVYFAIVNSDLKVNCMVQQWQYINHIIMFLQPPTLIIERQQKEE